MGRRIDLTIDQLQQPSLSTSPNAGHEALVTGNNHHQASSRVHVQQPAKASHRTNEARSGPRGSAPADQTEAAPRPPHQIMPPPSARVTLFTCASGPPCEPPLEQVPHGAPTQRGEEPVPATADVARALPGDAHQRRQEEHGGGCGFLSRSFAGE